MNVLDLFSGIGGFSLGLERAGMRTVAFCEIDPYCRAVLAKHWPGVPCYDDIRTLTAARLAADGIQVDAICGGFPCQDISTAGRGTGLAGERSGLWREYARLIGELRPRFVIVENVAALLARGLGDVLGDLAALGYDAEWHCIPASAVGAPHRRDRIWIMAHAKSLFRYGSEYNARGFSKSTSKNKNLSELKKRGCNSDVADTNSQGLEIGHVRYWAERFAGPGSEAIGGTWRTEPNVGRVANGVPARVDRLRALGNAVVPQIPEIIGRAIMRAAATTRPALPDT